ncbi:hypothetical protein CJP73_00615 [Neopusillimonas maritima]|uniref:Uncharacterized protein n=1 Tax=Neopusillimonas maritima TaxID=2026239 RepID=A0A3A1YUP5_9BURK|nr:hypothetical protein CJP73_00615 [Neopusillimonas maritima]
MADLTGALSKAGKPGMVIAKPWHPLPLRSRPDEGNRAPLSSSVQENVLAALTSLTSFTEPVPYLGLSATT